MVHSLHLCSFYLLFLLAHHPPYFVRLFLNMIICSDNREMFITALNAVQNTIVLKDTSSLVIFSFCFILT